MKITDRIYSDVNKFYNKIEDFTKKRPIEAIISDLALTIFSMSIFKISCILAFGAVGVSIFFDVAIYKNFSEICEKIEIQLIEIFKGPMAAERARGRSDANRLLNTAERLAARFKGFVEEISS